VAAGMVLTGGTAKMEGVVELAEEIFHMPVRLGSPQNIKGLTDIVDNPIYSTGVGLLLYGMQQQLEGAAPVKHRESHGEGFWSRVKGWFQGNL
jgi:cell division protein FtsA